MRAAARRARPQRCAPGARLPQRQSPPVPFGHLRAAHRRRRRRRRPGAPPTAEQRRSRTFEKSWRRWLHDGFIPGTAFTAPRHPPPLGRRRGASCWRTSPERPGRREGAPAAPAAPATVPARPLIAGIEVNFRRDPTIYDGRFANNGWLQELPKPVTKLTWDNAALIAPATAERLDVENGDIIEVTHEGRQLRIPVWINPGHAADAITIHLGYGRTRAGRVGNATGFNGYVLRGSTSPWFGAAEVSATGDDYELVTTQDHWTHRRPQHRPLRAARGVQGEARLREGDGAHEARQAASRCIPPHEYTGHAVGHGDRPEHLHGLQRVRGRLPGREQHPGRRQGAGVVATARCTGCASTATTTAPLDNPDTFMQPMPCQQCENAPCEVVCPVAATVHSDEGLNDMVYNRCVGTRYCSNNCPCKVRRFNFLLYQDWNTATLKLQRNPDVTVRSRGVMEKCTYCVQRINSARIQAKREDREIRDGEILTACQSACPTDSIVFGNINDPKSRVSQLKASPRNYATLEELNTRPRTTYLAAVRNPHPSLPTHASVGGHDTGRRTPGRASSTDGEQRSHARQFGGRPRRPGHRAGPRLRDGHRDRRADPAVEADAARLGRSAS